MCGDVPDIWSLFGIINRTIPGALSTGPAPLASQSSLPHQRSGVRYGRTDRRGASVPIISILPPPLAVLLPRCPPQRHGEESAQRAASARGSCLSTHPSREREREGERPPDPHLNPATLSLRGNPLARGDVAPLNSTPSNPPLPPPPTPGDKTPRPAPRAPRQGGVCRAAAPPLPRLRPPSRGRGRRGEE